MSIQKVKIGTTEHDLIAAKVNTSITVTLNGGATEGTNKFTFDGSTAKSVDITPSAIGISTLTNAEIDTISIS